MNAGEPGEPWEVGFDEEHAKRKRGEMIEFMEKRCARCKAPMTCHPEGNCWCAELPPGPMQIDPNDGCLCPECLRKALGISRAADEKTKPA